MSSISLHPPLTAAKGQRIESIDLLRGTVMIIMALDHVRDYFHGSAYLFDPTDMSRTSVFIFFTRWVTHFCAPIFMFLAGVSAHLYGARRTRKELSFFLLTRGLWLILAELFIVTFEWTFNPFYSMYILQVIWAFGFSMIVLSVMIYLPLRAILLIGILLIAGHNLLDGFHVPGGSFTAFLWSFLHEQHGFTFGPLSMFVGYPILPWIGIIAIGYCFGHLYTSGYDAVKRRKTLLAVGLATIAGFVLLRFINIYGDHSHWSVQQNTLFTFLSFLNTTKYPPSLLYVLMTLGPALVFLALSERPLNALTSRITIFGRVPMFFYLLHILVIHLLAILGAMYWGHPWTDEIFTGWVTGNARLRGYGFGLPFVYLVWVVVVIGLFPLCKWFDTYKRSHQAKQQWLSYF